ncbi:hypothetical protein GCM10023175_04670 [Pseudonocardia xishanensis]|uniref:Uncharacterized protein n=1 Tax=Pseudonocardia xishanensis TaxID=630995 RepID=A0ABP8REJ0_9PSEU
MASEVSASSDSHSPVAVTAVTPHSLRKAGMASTLRTRCAVGAGLLAAGPTPGISAPIEDHLHSPCGNRLRTGPRLRGERPDRRPG